MSAVILFFVACVAPGVDHVPLISVLVPCYNTSRYLRETVDSILGQTFGDFELVLFNDGSSDETEEVLREVAGLDGRIRTYSRENRGIVETRNELLELARGEFLSWHDSDDLMAPERLEWQLARMRIEPELVWVGGACTLMDPEGLPIRTHAFPTDHESICKIMEEEVGAYFGSTLMRANVARRAGGFRHPFRISEDFDLLLRMSEVGRVANIPQVVLFYRQHMTSTANSGRPRSYHYSRLVTALARERRERGTDRLQRGEPVAIDFGEMPTVKENRVETHRRWGWWALASGHLKTARKYALHALREAPHQLESWKLLACAIRGH